MQSAFEVFYEAIYKLKDTREHFEKGIELAKDEKLMEEGINCINLMKELVKNIAKIQSAYMSEFLEIEHIFETTTDPNNTKLFFNIIKGR